MGCPQVISLPIQDFSVFVWRAFERGNNGESLKASQAELLSFFFVRIRENGKVCWQYCVGFHHFYSLERPKPLLRFCFRRFRRKRNFHLNKKIREKQAEFSTRKKAVFIVEIFSFFFLCRHLHLSWGKECEDKTQMILWHLILFPSRLFIRVVDEAQKKILKSCLTIFIMYKKKLFRWRNFRERRNSCRKHNKKALKYCDTLIRLSQYYF